MAGYLNLKPGHNPTAPLPSSELDGSETSCSPRLEQTPTQLKIHGRWESTRRWLHHIIAGGDDRSLWRRSERMAKCGLGAVITARDDGTAGIRVNMCRDRACPTCSISRGREVAERVEKVIDGLATCRMITLTLKADQGSLKARLDRLISCFRLLRREEQWSEAVSGGIYTIEVTRNERTNNWHVHLHALVYGKYLPHGRLKRLWLKVTGDSEIVHVRAVESSKKAAWYVAKYATKPTDPMAWAPSKVREWLSTMHGRRLVSVIGECHGWKESVKKNDDRPGIVGDVVGVGRMCHLARTGFDPARRGVDLLGQLAGLFSLVAPRISELSLCDNEARSEALRELLVCAEACQTVQADQHLMTYYRRVDEQPPDRKTRRAFLHPNLDWPD